MPENEAKEAKKDIADLLKKAREHVTGLNKLGVGFAATNKFDESQYGRGLRKQIEDATTEVGKLDLSADKTKAVSTALNTLLTNVQTKYQAIVTDPQYGWKQDEWNNDFQSAMNALTDLEKANDASARVKEFANKTKQALEEFQKEKFHDEVNSLERSLASQESTNKIVKMAEQIAIHAGYYGKNAYRSMFTPITPQLEEEDVREQDQAAALRTVSEEQFRRQLKKVIVSQDTYYQSKQFPRVLFSCQHLQDKEGKNAYWSGKPARSPSDAKDYVEQYLATVDLLRFKEPSAQLTFCIPIVTRVARGEEHHTTESDVMRILSTGFIKDKLTAVIQKAAEEKGVVVGIDPDLRALLVKVKIEEQKDRWSLTKKLFGDKSDREKAIDALFEWEEKVQKRNLRGEMLGKDESGMKERAESMEHALDEHKNAELKNQYDTKMKAFEGKQPEALVGEAAVPAATGVPANMTNEQKEEKVFEQMNLNTLRSAAEREAPLGDASQKVAFIQKQLAAVTKGIKTAADAAYLIQGQVNLLNDRIKKEDESSFSRDGNSFSVTHGKRLEALRIAQAARLEELRIKAKILEKEMSQIAKETPGDEARQKLAMQTKDCVRELERMKEANTAHLKDIVGRYNDTQAQELQSAQQRGPQPNGAG